MRGRVLLVVGLLAVPTVGCHLRDGQRPHELAGAGGEALRAAFNGDAGKVRVVILVSPT